ncbi:hypothetical protein Acr_21g0006820 [Actinidia rufa]|uniref:Uncharacterized protein n=1 Tax=Actinidia rufa TaxID=165716 RepID=A0A7J0GGY7_9ERIC|nr:hypothetical protein Acr_21g0006820 [Actinidia rufa]
MARTNAEPDEILNQHDAALKKQGKRIEELQATVFEKEKSEPNRTAMPVIAMVKRRRLRENSCGGCLLRASCSLSAALVALQNSK